ncbi:Golgi integral membrane protein 4 [Carlito syrichta]|uniref:Golgi integral membrane protein 4 n=1 Tax=Carlito syrichta TaxID=1868482 RepID=A0A3Q0E1U2_CARSF|nr:Golgi integral membrane protein 4 [Carlito syrichta]
MLLRWFVSFHGGETIMGISGHRPATVMPLRVPASAREPYAGACGSRASTTWLFVEAVCACRSPVCSTARQHPDSLVNSSGHTPAASRDRACGLFRGPGGRRMEDRMVSADVCVGTEGTQSQMLGGIQVETLFQCPRGWSWRYRCGWLWYRQAGDGLSGQGCRGDAPQGCRNVSGRGGKSKVLALAPERAGCKPTPCQNWSLASGGFCFHCTNFDSFFLVVYEHRSRLEKSLQKERLEHKKAKEDFLVYKLEAQETLNKGRQDSNSRYSALNVQHQMLKSQHEELKKQHSDLEEEHRRQGEDFSRTFSDHKQRFLQLQQEKEQELSKLKETVYNLREENRQLRKAHQDIHTQLQDVKQQHKSLLSEHEQLVVTLDDHKRALAAAQTQVAEYKQLKDTLHRIPSSSSSTAVALPSHQQSPAASILARPNRLLPPLSPRPPRSAQRVPRPSLGSCAETSPRGQQAHYDAMDNDIVQGAEDQGVQEEEGAYERDSQHQDDGEGNPGHRHESREQGPREADLEPEADRAAVEDINPADDPNNQGEDEFEEAAQVREENLPDGHGEPRQTQQNQEEADMEEHLVVAGNPDQQEDNADEQYQEEGEEEVQEDLTEEKKRELERDAEEPYADNAENAEGKTNEGEEQEIREDSRPTGREEHYEEEDEEDDRVAGARKPRGKAEMSGRECWMMGLNPPLLHRWTAVPFHRQLLFRQVSIQAKIRGLEEIALRCKDKCDWFSADVGTPSP